MRLQTLNIRLGVDGDDVVEGDVEVVDLDGAEDGGPHHQHHGADLHVPAAGLHHVPVQVPIDGSELVRQNNHRVFGGQIQLNNFTQEIRNNVA